YIQYVHNNYLLYIISRNMTCLLREKSGQIAHPILTSKLIVYNPTPTISVIYTKYTFPIT
ncbi:hypothetical protein, partial [Enterococcus cecorum]|uniref:hypothetical protein n=1 Tax=Enterococcus cecorum TaxID=44008 RepID=UPI001FADDB59